MKTIVIGVAGGSGSGKTTLAHKLQLAFPGDVTILCHDFYYKSNDHLPFEERVKLNYDHPDAFDTQRMVEDLKKLKAAQAIEHPVYSFVEHTRKPGGVRLEPTRVIVVEGILIYESKPLRDLMDIKVFVDTDADVRLIRRILRDVEDRGRSLTSVIEQYLKTVKPMHEQYVEPSKKHVDIIIPEGGFNSVALQMLVGQIRHFVNSVDEDLGPKNP